MVEFLLFLNLIFNIVIFCLVLSILRTTDNNTDLILDLERQIRRLFYYRKGRK